MNPFVLSVLILCLVFGVAHGADLAFGIDYATGFCIVGSVWLRYVVLAAVVVLAVLAGHLTASRPQALRKKMPLAGALMLCAAIFYAVAGVAGVLSATGVASIMRAVLEVVCAAWLVLLGRSWMRAGTWQRPTKGAAPAVFGSVLFYWNVLARFMENSSSWYRVKQTAAVWQELAMLVFLAALVRALYIPEPKNGKTLCAGAMAAAALCLCWQLPQSIELVVHYGGSVLLPAVAAQLFAGLGMCCLGGAAAVCAVQITQDAVGR